MLVLLHCHHFSLAELNSEISGHDFLRAAIAGYEIGPRVGLCMGQEHIGRVGTLVQLLVFFLQWLVPRSSGIDA